MLTPTKMKIIIASVSTVGLGAGAAGVVYGLTKPVKKEEIIVPEPVPISGHTVTLHYGGHTKDLPCQTLESLQDPPQIPKDWLEPHYVSQGWYSDSGFTSQIEFPYDIQKDTDFYLKAGMGMGKVYLHTDTNPYGTTYNGTDDWYPTEQYKEELGSGFAKRDEPTIDNYEKLGWARVDTDMTGDWRSPTINDLLPKDDDWTVYPEAGRIAHLYPMYELKDTTFTFRDKEGKELLSPLTTSCEEGTERVFQDPGAEDIKHYRFIDWAYAEDCKVIVNGEQKDREAGTLVGDDTTAGFVDPSVKLVANVEQIQHSAKFYMDKACTESKAELIWADMNEGGEATITQEMVSKLITPTGDENEEFVFWTEDGSTESKWPIIINNDDRVFKPHFESATTVVHVDFDGAKWVNNSGIEKPTDGANISVMPSKNYSTNELMDKARVAAGLGDDTTYHLVGTNGNLNNFYGWSLNGSVETSFNFGETQGQTIIAAFNNIDDITVTFNTAGGYFNYTNSYGDVESVTSLSMDINIPTWREAHGGKVKVSEVYSTLLENYTAELKRDGFKLNEGKIYGDTYGEYSGWTYMGNNLPDEFETTTSMSLFAEWKEKEATGDWWADDWYTIAKLADEPAESDQTVTGTKLEEVYSEAFKGTDADGTTGEETKAADNFVGLQKEIDLPQLGSDSFTTRVIGQNVDTISGGSTKALLTFDFVDCPATGPFGLENDYKDNNASFNNSTTKSSVRAAMPEGLRSSLKTVTKYSMDTTKLAPEELNTDLFLLSATEINGQNTYSSKIESDEGDDNFFTYEYYAQDPSGTARSTNDIGTNAQTHKHRVKYYNGQAISWWTRTPVHQDHGWRTTGAAETNTANAWYVTYGEGSQGTKPYNGGVWMYGCVEARGLSPAFCIGTYLGE